MDAVFLPFRDYFTREGAWLALLFILLYKLGDTMASAMTTPFYLDLGYSLTDIGAVVKLFGGNFDEAHAEAQRLADLHRDTHRDRRRPAEWRIIPAAAQLAT